MDIEKSDITAVFLCFRKKLALLAERLDAGVGLCFLYRFFQHFESQRLVVDT